MYDELIERLRASCESCKLWDGYKCCLKGECSAQKSLQAADAIEDLENRLNLWRQDKIRRWIPVTERLPNCNGCYLVWRPHFFGGEVGMPSICYFDGSNTWHDSYGVDFERILHPEDITHWMPLPKPPKEKT